MAGTGGTFKSSSRTEPSPPGANVVTISFPATAGPPPVAAYDEDYTVSDATYVALTSAPKSATLDTTGTAPAIGMVTVHK